MTVRKGLDRITLDEFYDFIEDQTQLYELIDGSIYGMSSPSTIHQIISGNLYLEFRKYFKGKCAVIIAPHDVILEDDFNSNLVIPDISVISDKQNFDVNSKGYNGVPSLIVEVVSQGNATNDTIRKLNLYMRYGVKEYWIINPIDKNITIYSLTQKGTYEIAVAADEGIIKSPMFKGLEISFEDLFIAY